MTKNKEIKITTKNNTIQIKNYIYLPKNKLNQILEILKKYRISAKVGQEFTLIFSTFKGDQELLEIFK